MGKRGRTTILISHRISTVRLAERIYVLTKVELSKPARTRNSWPPAATYADLNQKQLLEAELESI